MNKLVKLKYRFASIGLPVMLSILVALVVMTATRVSLARDQNQSEKDRVVPSGQLSMKYSFAPVVKQALPAVVNVYVRHKTRRKRKNPFANHPFLREFFGDNLGIPRERIEKSLGSGVIIDESGLVVTNYHVIEGATTNEIKVALANRKEYQADILLKDKKTDLAVLKIRTKGVSFPYLDLANSDELEVGDLVLAMGNPFGVGQTVTSGIVSALARSGIGKGDAQYFIQTDAAINPGNSGGALVDVNGDLIGINTAIFSKSGGSLGIGFAIPSNLVRLIVNSARNGRSVQRPWFGGTLKALTAEVSESLRLPKPPGIYIASLGDESPAQDAGLRVGDVIVAVNEHPILDSRAFRYHFSIKGTGGRANIKIWRDGRTLHKLVSLIAAPETPAKNETRIRGNNPFSGAVIANLSPAVAEDISLSDQSGVVVLGVARRSYARRYGLAKKDILTEVNGIEIDSVTGLLETMRGQRRYWSFTIKRGNELISVPLGR